MEWKVVAFEPNGDPKEWSLMGQDLAKIRAGLCVCSGEHFRIFVDNFYCVLNVQKKDLGPPGRGPLRPSGPLPEFLEGITEPLVAYVADGRQKKNQCDLCGENTIETCSELFTHFRQKHWSGSMVKSAMKA